MLQAGPQMMGCLGHTEIPEVYDEHEENGESKRDQSIPQAAQ